MTRANRQVMSRVRDPRLLENPRFRKPASQMDGWMDGWMDGLDG